MKMTTRISVSLAMVVLLAGTTVGAQDPVSTHDSPMKFVAYDIGQKAKVALSAWVAPEKAMRAQVVVYSSPESPEAFDVAWEAVQNGGLIAFQPTGTDLFEVISLEGAEKLLGHEINTVEALKLAVSQSKKKYEKFGIVIKAEDWTQKTYLADIVSNISVDNTKLIAWNPDPYLSKKMIHQ